MTSTSDLPPFTPSPPKFTYTQPPNPSWSYGQSVDQTEEGRKWLEGEKEGWVGIDTNLENPKLYSILISGVVPRPVAFVSSVSKHGVENLAPFSWFNQVSTTPPVISISCSHTASKSGNLKDTASNILETESFIVNIISEPWIQQANMATIDAPHDVSEWGVTGLGKIPGVVSKAPRVRESAFAMECELLQSIPITDPSTQTVTTTLILGTIKYVHIRKDVIDPQKGTVDPGKLKAVARLGGWLYGRVNEGYVLPREKWQDKEEELRKIVGDEKPYKPSSANL